MSIVFNFLGASPPQGSTMSEPTPIDLARDWAKSMAAASRNLMDFSTCEMATFIKARLRHDHPRPYRGETLRRGLAAKNELETILQDHLPLTRVVDEALMLANKSNRFFNNEKAVLALLLGSTVRLTRPIEDDDPSRRDLLQGERPEEFTTPKDALQSMQRRFAIARDEFVLISQTEETLVEGIAKLLADREAAGLDTHIALDDSDPLASLDALEAARKDLREFQDAIADRASASAKAEAQLLAASKAIVALKALAARNAMLVAESQMNISTPPGFSFASCSSAEAFVFFENWRSKIASTAEAGRVDAALVGSAKLLASIEERSRLDAQAAAANRRLLDEAADLRGRFDAYRIKSLSLVARGATPSASVLELQDACEQAFALRPMDLPSLRRLSTAYGAAISALGT